MAQSSTTIVIEPPTAAIESQSDREETLRRLLDRLTATDVTLGEARAIRSELAGLIGVTAEILDDGPCHEHFPCTQPNVHIAA